jgi:hypothetical protein
VGGALDAPQRNRLRDLSIVLKSSKATGISSFMRDNAAYRLRWRPMDQSRCFPMEVRTVKAAGPDLLSSELFTLSSIIIRILNCRDIEVSGDKNLNINSLVITYQMGVMDGMAQAFRVVAAFW